MTSSSSSSSCPIEVASFVAGFCYGGTTVLVGQPLDTLKTLQQASSASASTPPASTSATTHVSAPTASLQHPQQRHYASTTLPIQPKQHAQNLHNHQRSLLCLGRELHAQGGIRAFYRGGVPLLLGGGLMRSAQFGVYNATLEAIRRYQGGSTDPVHGRYVFGAIDPQVVSAGIMGGLGRGVVEGPFEFFKVRRQVQNAQPLSKVRDIFQGSGTTLVRNSFLFSTFVVYMDVFQQCGIHLSPFWMGGICANLAWLTIWPLDVVKSRVQSGHYHGQSSYQILRSVMKQGHMFHGLVPGLLRSFIANGSSMVVYKYVENELRKF